MKFPEGWRFKGQDYFYVHYFMGHLLKMYLHASAFLKHWTCEPKLTVQWWFISFCICLLFSFVTFLWFLFCYGLLSFYLSGVCSISPPNDNNKTKKPFSCFIASAHFWVGDQWACGELYVIKEWIVFEQWSLLVMKFLDLALTVLSS